MKIAARRKLPNAYIRFIEGVFAMRNTDEAVERQSDYRGKLAEDRSEHTALSTFS